MRVYRLTVDSWPTPDGKPFDRQDEEFWEQITDAYHNPDGGNEWPDWLGDITEWLDTTATTWEPSSPAWKAGRWYAEAGLTVPPVPRRHWFSRAAAERKADDLRLWGCVVRVEASEPVTWEVES